MLPRATLASLAATLVGGCSWLPPAEPPRVSLAELRPLTATADGQRYRLRLRVENPARAPLEVERVAYRVVLADQDLGSGVSPHAFAVPARGERLVEVDLAAQPLRRIDPLRRRAGRPAEGPAFRLTGELELAGARGELRFEQEGELPPDGGGS